MKPHFLRAALLGAMMITLAGVHAQHAAPTEKRLNSQQFDEQVQAIVLSADYMVQELGLSEAQAEKLGSIEADLNQRERALAGLGLEERAAQGAVIAAERARLLASVLTPAQRQQAEELKRQIVLSQFGDPVDAPEGK